MGAMNAQAMLLVRRELILADPAERGTLGPAASLKASRLADAWCADDSCPDMTNGLACRRHRSTFMLGVSKLIAGHEVSGDLSRSGVLYLRITPTGVVTPLTWGRPPHWFEGVRPELLLWGLERGWPESVEQARSKHPGLIAELVSRAEAV